MSNTITERVTNTAFDLLEQHPEGLRFMELITKIKERDANFNTNTINGCIWNLDARFPQKVYKPSKGLFRLTKFKDALEEEGPEAKQPRVVVPSNVREE